MPKLTALARLRISGDTISITMTQSNAVNLNVTSSTAQGNTAGSADGAPLPNLDYVLGEPEVRPVTMTGPFSDSSMRPLEFRTQALNFSIRIEPGTADWIWGGETKFRGVEECHMPTMKIPEFAVEGVVQ